ncbi:MAG: sulfite exporter TauE/SafE family protein [Spirochaeta sp.]|nr:sulfite exporter TauE/SafE family protein [Spirochaeta sp.]
MSSLIIVVVILFIAELVRSSIGFGNALVAMPLLVLVIDLRLATPLVALVSMTAAMVILGSSLQDVRFSDAWRLNLGALAGVPLGVLILNNVPQQLGVGIIALLIIGYGGYSLMRPNLPHLRVSWPAFGVGAIAGMIGAAFNISGPPVVVYAGLRRWSPKDSRATLQSFFVPTGILVIAGHGLTGLWSTELLQLFLLSLPGVLLATVVGRRVNHRVSYRSFQRVINLFLIAMGFFMLARLW